MSGVSSEMVGVAAVQPASRETVRGWVTAMAAMVCLAVGPSALLVTGFGVFVRPIADDFGWGVGQVTFAISIVALILVAVSPLQGVLIDRFGPRRVILCSIPALAAGLIGLQWMPPSLPVFYLAWAALPLLAIGVWPVSYLKLVSGWFDRNLGLAIGTANAGIGLGAIIVPPIAAAMVKAAGWRWAYVGLGLLALSAGPLAAWLLREKCPDPGVAREIGLAPQLRLPALLADRDFRSLAAAYFFIGVTGTGMIANLAPMLIHSGFPADRTVWAMSLLGFATLGGRFLAGYLLDRYFVGVIMAWFIAGAMLATVGFAFGAPQTLSLVGALLLGLVMGAEFDALAYAVRRYFGMASFGRIYGLIFGVFQLGAALGAAFLSFTVTWTGSYALGMAVFSATLAISLVLFAGLRPYRLSVA